MLETFITVAPYGNRFRVEIYSERQQNVECTPGVHLVGWEPCVATRNEALRKAIKLSRNTNIPLIVEEKHLRV